MRVDRLSLRLQIERRQKFRASARLVIGARGRGGEPAAVPPHHLVDQKRARARGRLVDDVLEKDRALFGGGHRAHRLADRHDVVVDRFRQPDDGQRVAVVAEIFREVGGGGDGVVAADRVEDGDAVGGELLGGDLAAGSRLP